MIPNYRLFNYLLLLKSNYFFKREIKNKISHLKAQYYRNSYELIFNINQNLMFVKLISIYLYFNKLSYKKYLKLIANYILIISALTPVLKKQSKQLDNYINIKKILLSIGCHGIIKIWFNNSKKIILPQFLLNNKNFKNENLLIFQRLINISGNIFSIFTNIQKRKKINFQFGSLLMLFYLLDLETRKTIFKKDITDLNLKNIFNYELLFINKLMILDKLVNYTMLLEKNNFNFYIRIMNYLLLINYS